MGMDTLALADRRNPYTLSAADARSPADVDYSRVIHCASFRRLQGKTQILNLGDSDFYRTRLTHTLEVAQLAHGLVLHLQKFHSDHPLAADFPCSTLAQAISLTHDLGHPPFGHGGEVALNYCMRNHGGFEGNGQTLRILSRLEKMSASAGLNLSRRAMLGALKYPAPLSQLKNPALTPRLRPEPGRALGLLDRASCTPPKGYFDCDHEAVDWILAPLSEHDRAQFIAVRRVCGKHGKTSHKSFDGSVMDVADDLAYGVHDLEDAISLRLITRERFEAHVTREDCAGFLEHLRDAYGARTGNDAYGYMLDRLFGNEDRCKQMISRMINYLIPAAGIIELPEFEEPLLRYRVALAPLAERFLAALQRCVAHEVIFSPNVQHLELKGQTMVVAVFEVLASEPDKFLPRPAYESYRDSGDDLRVICDHVAAMTDGVLMKTYDRLFSPRMGSVFDRL